MSERATRAGVALWPHAKTHKSSKVARLQLAHGAAGLTVATVREAALFADAGFDNLLVAYPPVGTQRLEALMQLASRVNLRVVLDDVLTVEILHDAARKSGMSIGYLWEVDCGVGRCGTTPGAQTAERILAAQRFTHASYEGLMTFGGHAYSAADAEGIRAAAQDEKSALSASAEALAEHGIESPARSAGTTPTSHQLGKAGPITEIRPGNYVYYDATQVTLGIAEIENCALAVLATVVSRPDPRRLILDCGSKALGADLMSARSLGFGLVQDHPEFVVDRLYEEHAILSSSETCDIPIGARLRVIPNHSCATANLHTNMLILEKDVVVDVWSVDARGWEIPAY